jgi:uncharacterized protein (DUF362 family)
MGVVSVIYGIDVHDMVRRLVEQTGSLQSIRQDDAVVLKPNLVASRQHWAGIDTDPRVVEGLVILLKEKGVGRITVCDGSGMGQSATRAFEYCGYTELAKRYGVQLLDLEKDRFVKRPVAVEGPFKSLEIAKTVAEADFLINVPVMKAHGETLVTCSLKNLKGTMPRSMKTSFHGVNLHLAIAQLNSILSPQLIVVDGLQGDLYSETGRDPVAMERIILGTNPVEVDSVVADMLGYAPSDIRHIAYSARAGIGTCDLSGIEVRALNRPTVNERFAPQKHYSERFACSVTAEGACCTCLGNLIFALERLDERRLLSKNVHFFVGQNVSMPRQREGKDVNIAVGRCATQSGGATVSIDQCPPSAGEILHLTVEALKQLR